MGTQLFIVIGRPIGLVLITRLRANLLKLFVRLRGHHGLLAFLLAWLLLLILLVHLLG